MCYRWSSVLWYPEIEIFFANFERNQHQRGKPIKSWQKSLIYPKFHQFQHNFRNFLTISPQFQKFQTISPHFKKSSSILVYFIDIWKEILFLQSKISFGAPMNTCRASFIFLHLVIRTLLNSGNDVQRPEPYSKCLGTEVFEQFSIVFGVSSLLCVPFLINLRRIASLM